MSYTPRHAARHKVRPLWVDVLLIIMAVLGLLWTIMMGNWLSAILFLLVIVMGVASVTDPAR